MREQGVSLRWLMGVLTLCLGSLLWGWTQHAGGPPTAAESPPAGEAGPFLLGEGHRVVFTFSALGTERGFEESGGNLVGIQLDRTDLGFGSMTTFLDRSFPRQGRYSQLTPVTNGLISLGVDSGNDAVEVETRWQVLDPEDPRVLGQLSVQTTVTNRGQETLEEYEVGDIISWGAFEHFAPGPGTKLAGEDLSLSWIGASGPQGAILVASGNQLTGPHGSSWSDPVWTSASLGPGESLSVERWFFVGKHLGDLVGPALRLQGRVTTKLDLLIQEDKSQRGVQGAGLTVHRLTSGGETEPVARAQTDQFGKASVDLEPGNYRIEANAAARRSHQPVEVKVPTKVQEPVVLHLSHPGALKVRVVGPEGVLLPARLDFEGLDSTPDPVLGTASRAHGMNRAYVLGGGQINLPPGRYRTTTSHGPAWSLSSADIEVAALEGEAEPTVLEVQLVPLVQPPGWIHCDFHQHANYSPDSAVQPVEGLIASAAEGLTCIATTDHDAVADWVPHLAEAGVEDSMIWLPGIEVTSETVGHYNAFPWEPSLGIVPHRGKTSKQVVATMRERSPEALIQLNHPLWGSIGLWNLVGLDQETGQPRALDDAGVPTEAADDFDLIEVLNGKDTEHSEKTVQAWLRLLASTDGKAPGAVGNSDSHRLVGQERGSSRTWLQGCLEGQVKDAREVVEAIRGGCRYTASTGPFLDLRATEPSPGPETSFGIEIEMLAPEWMPVDEIELYGAAPSPSQPRSIGRWGPGLVPMSASTTEGRTRWLLRLNIPADGSTQWVVAIARGKSPMLPWSDAVALAVTGPLAILP